jgi:hypothetical protein
MAIASKIGHGRTPGVIPAQMRVQPAVPKAALVDGVVEGVKAGLLVPASCPLQSGGRAPDVVNAGVLVSIASTHSRTGCMHLTSIRASRDAKGVVATRSSVGRVDESVER